MQTEEGASTTEVALIASAVTAGAILILGGGAYGLRPIMIEQAVCENGLR